jgi:hypothetical protein
MKAVNAIDKTARAGRATQIAAVVITCMVALMWMYFGRLYLIHDPEEWRIANQQLGYREFDSPHSKVDVAVAIAQPVMVVRDHGTDEEWQAKAIAQQQALIRLD